MEINVFKFCSGLRVLGYVMILLVAVIVGVSYYAVVSLTYGPLLLRGGFDSFLSFIIVIIFHVLLVLLLWSYIRVVLKDPGSVPENWRAVPGEESLEVGTSLAAAEDGFERRSRGGGYCIHCQNGKPPRCHHCSIFLNFAFALSLLCFVVMHASLLSSNTTSVEVHEKKGVVRWKYNLGRKKNFEQVFGTKKSLWLFPLFSEDDLEKIPALHGLEFPTRSDVDA